MTGVIALQVWYNTRVADDHTTRYSLYLHIPFCQVRCAYCDFNTYAGLDDLITPYSRALAAEVEGVGEAGGRPMAHTVFFGGGTPSLLPLGDLSRVLDAIRASFHLAADAEITLEANPGTVTRDYLFGLRALGVNRLSFGVQSTHPHELRLLDRMHLFGDAAQAVSWARAAGFDDLNLDLIFALPHQTLDRWRQTVERTLALGPDHISAYALSLEHGTPMRAWVYRGLLPLPDPDVAADMYLLADELLARNGFEQYEISNWSRPGRACRHNLQYWRNEPYLGFGAGAHGYAQGQRYANVLAPTAYIERLAGPGDVGFPHSPAMMQTTRIEHEDEIGETMMMGLRLTREGVPLERFASRFGKTLDTRFGREIRELSRRGLIEVSEGRLRLTREGRLLGNHVFREFV